MKTVVLLLLSLVFTGFMPNSSKEIDINNQLLNIMQEQAENIISEDEDSKFAIVAIDIKTGEVILNKST